MANFCQITWVIQFAKFLTSRSVTCYSAYQKFPLWEYCSFTPTIVLPLKILINGSSCWNYRKIQFFISLTLFVSILITTNFHKYTFRFKTRNYSQTLNIKLKSVRLSKKWLWETKLINNILIPNFSFDVSQYCYILTSGF